MKNEEATTEVTLDDSNISKAKKSINQLRESLNMIEWCLDENDYSIRLWLDTLIEEAKEVVAQFQE